MGYPVLAACQNFRRTCWVLLLSSLPMPALAVEQDAQLWSTVHLGGMLSDQVSANMELQARLTEDGAVLGQQFVRPSLTYHFSDAFNASLGYAYVLTNTSQAVSFREDRSWQQLGYRLYHNDYEVALSGRTRLEQRFIEGEGETGWRLRHQTRLEVPFRPKGHHKMLTWNETFYKFNGTGPGQRGGFDQTRNFAGVALRVAENVSAETGYLNQTIFRSGEDSMNHALVTTLTIKF